MLYWRRWAAWKELLWKPGWEEGLLGIGVQETFPLGEGLQASSPCPQVWSEQDFQYLRQKLLPTYPAAHYFRR